MRAVRNILFCLMLAVNCLHGTPVRPEEIEALMQAMNTPKVAHVLPDEDYDGDDKLPGLQPLP
jgi:hypothetical protein